MPLSSLTLSDKIEELLENLTGSSPVPADAGWAEAYGEYFKGALLAGVPASPTAVDNGKAPIESSIAFSSGSTPIEGAQEITNGILAFWVHLNANLSTYFPNGTPPAVHPGIAGLPVALLAAFALNNLPGVTRAQAAVNLASAIHSTAGIGGTALVATVATPIT